MNSPHHPIPDVQNFTDTRDLAIDRVGIKSIRHPIRLRSPDGASLQTVAVFSMYVSLPPEVKGTHMSRFIELLGIQPLGVAPQEFRQLLRDTANRLEARHAHIELSFPYFITKTAPVSGVQSLLDYEVTLKGEITDGIVTQTLKVLAPVTSLCPCSKTISERGAHNQRSHVTVTAQLRGDITIEEIAALIEKEASCELYGLLKRPDEKYVTERAYDNPKFVEDLVRDVAGRLNSDDRIGPYVVESENFESIHNHSAYALIQNDKHKGN